MNSIHSWGFRFMSISTESLKTSLKNERDTTARTKLLLDFMRATGQTFYDESVTQLAHALQCAHLAVKANADDATVVGALLHDFGHFLQNEHADNGDFLKSDLLHEDVAADFLAEFLPKSVVEPIRFHVLAKRYLCTVDEAYHDQLSPASQNSLRLQGGKLTEAEVDELKKNPHLEAILQVRRWDDLAKKAGKVVPTLETYTDQLTSTWL